MAQIKNINTAPIVNPNNVYILALKDGHLSRVDANLLMTNESWEQAKEHANTVINAAAETQNKKAENLEKKINDLEKKVNELKAALEKAVADISSSVETDESSDDTKKVVKKITKKSAE